MFEPNHYIFAGPDHKITVGEVINKTLKSALKGLATAVCILLPLLWLAAAALQQWPQAEESIVLSLQWAAAIATIIMAGKTYTCLTEDAYYVLEKWQVIVFGCFNVPVLFGFIWLVGYAYTH